MEKQKNENAVRILGLKVASSRFPVSGSQFQGPRVPKFQGPRSQGSRSKVLILNYAVHYVSKSKNMRKYFEARRIIKCDKGKGIENVIGCD